MTNGGYIEVKRITMIEPEMIEPEMRKPTVEQVAFLAGIHKTT